MSNDFNIRPATPGDAENLATLSTAVWINTYAKNGVRRSYSSYVLQEFTPTKFDEILTTNNKLIWLVENECSILGYIQLNLNSPCPNNKGCEIEIDRLYILDRFSRKGIGQSLLNTALAHCRDINATQIWLSTNHENSSAINFYQKNDFNIIGSITFELDDGQHPNHVFIRDF